MNQTERQPTAAARFGPIRDAVIAIVLIALGVAIVALYQIEAANTEPVSISQNTGGAASQLARGANEKTDTAAAIPDTPLDKWLAGPHADTYVVAEDGTNSTCNRCHDPINYVPSMADMPASCTVCKFEVKPPPPLIEQANAHSVDCKVCHRVDRSGTVLADVMWLEVAAIEQYADVSSVNQLCQYCHSGAGVQGHADIQLGGAHADLTCTDCHDAHMMTASCGASGCHETLAETPGHDADHANVHCVACHDAGGMDVGPDESRGGQWVTFAGGDAEDPFPHLSHMLAREVACDRCHAEALPETDE